MVEKEITFFKKPFVILTGKNSKCREDSNLPVLDCEKFPFSHLLTNYTIPHDPTHGNTMGVAARNLFSFK